MKKIVRLTESELKNIVEASVKRAIQEGEVDEGFGKDMLKTAAIGGGLGLGMAGAAGAGAFDSDPLLNDPQGAFPEDKAEFGDRLKPTNSIPSQKEIPDSSTISWGNAKKMASSKKKEFESRIRRAVMESIINLMNEGKTADTQLPK